MQNIFEDLFIENEEYEIDQSIQNQFTESLNYLLENCNKQEQGYVIKLIDCKDFICHTRALESFKCGFWLARRLETQLTNYQKKRLQHHCMPVEDPLYFIEEE